MTHIICVFMCVCVCVCLCVYVDPVHQPLLYMKHNMFTSLIRYMCSVFVTTTQITFWPIVSSTTLLLLLKSLHCHIVIVSVVVVQVVRMLAHSLHTIVYMLSGSPVVVVRTTLEHHLLLLQLHLLLHNPPVEVVMHLHVSHLGHLQMFPMWVAVDARIVVVKMVVVVVVVDVVVDNVEVVDGGIDLMQARLLFLRTWVQVEGCVWMHP
jgi:hypothetical protein